MSHDTSVHVESDAQPTVVWADRAYAVVIGEQPHTSLTERIRNAAIQSVSAAEDPLSLPHLDTSNPAPAGISNLTLRE